MIPAGTIFSEQIEEIRKAFDEERITWTKPGNFHITLHFFGNTGENEIPVIQQILEETARDYAPFRFHVSGMGIFKNLNHPRVLWLGLSETGKMQQVRDDLEKRLAVRGFKTDDRPFRPHLTLGRIRKLKNGDQAEEVLEKYRDTKFLQVEAKELVYYESILTEEGPVYTALSVHRLGE